MADLVGTITTGVTLEGTLNIIDLSSGDIVIGSTISGQIVGGPKGEKGDTGPQGIPGVVQAIVPGNNIDVDNSDPAAPIVSVENLVVADITDLTPTAAELNYVDGVTSAIQTQIDAKVAKNSNITGATKTKVTYDAKGLVTAGEDATTSDIPDSLNKRYVTDAQKTVLADTSGVNTGDQNLSGLVPKTTTVNGHSLASDVNVTKGDVGLGNANDTADIDKPISTAQQNALNLKAPLASPTFTGTVSGITKSMVGLGNVDNTPDASKPISTATQAALDEKVSSIVPGTNITVDDTDPENPVVNATAEPQQYFDFIFNSSGDQEENRFNDWTDLFAAMPAERTHITVQFEQDETWDVAGSYNMENVSFRGTGGSFISGSAIDLIVDDGVTFSSVVNFSIDNGIFFHSQSHDPIAIITDQVTVRATTQSAFVTDYCEIFRQTGAGALTLNLVPGGAIGNLIEFFGLGYEVVSVESTTGEGFQVRFGGFSSFIMNNTVRGDSGNFVIIKEDIGYFETEAVGIPGLGNLDSTHENYTSGEIGRLSLVQAHQIDISAIEGLVATQVQAALEELAERPGGVPDDAYTELDLTGKIYNFLGGSYLDMGTDGFANLRWRRLGRQVEGYFVSRWGADCEYGTFTILPTDLPFMPRTPLGAEVGMFCYLQVGPTSEGADDGYLLPLGSVLTDVGLGMPIIMLVQLSGAPGDGGLDNIFYSNGNPIDLTGREFNVYGRIAYECAGPVGTELSTDGEFTAEATQDEAYSSAIDIITTSDDQYPITVEFGLGTPPTGFSVDVVDHQVVISGTTSDAVDTYDFQIILTDVDGLEYVKTVSIDVLSGGFDLDWPGGAYTAGEVGLSYSHTISATYDDSSQLPLVPTLVSGALPDGLTMDIQDDYKVRLSGTPTVDDTFNFRIKVTDQLSTESENDASMVIAAYNPEHDPNYLGTVSGNSLNIIFQDGRPVESILTYTATLGEILKIRSGAMTHDFGEGALNVPIGGFIHYEGGYWREYTY